MCVVLSIVAIIMGFALGFATGLGIGHQDKQDRIKELEEGIIKGRIREVRKAYGN